jgi:hypothetical protein
MTRRQSSASPWASLLPTSTGTPEQGAGLPSRKINGGKLLPEKVRKAHDRAVFSRAFIQQLEISLAKRARELDDLWDLGTITKQVAARTTSLFCYTCKAIDRTLDHHKEGAPPTLRDFGNLLTQVATFEFAMDRLLTCKNEDEFYLAFCLRDLCDDIEHCVRQLRMTYAIVSVENGRVTPANRPTNWAAKQSYAELIRAHQQQYGRDTYPTPRYVIEQLQKSGHQVSARTLRDWRSQVRNGTFSSYVQNRKRQ